MEIKLPYKKSNWTMDLEKCDSTFYIYTKKYKYISCTQTFWWIFLSVLINNGHVQDMLVTEQGEYQQSVSSHCALKRRPEKLSDNFYHSTEKEDFFNSKRKIHN